MLGSVKSVIQQSEELPDFEEYYMDYIFRVQDMNISNELKHMIRKNRLKLNSYQYLIHTTLERVIPNAFSK